MPVAFKTLKTLNLQSYFYQYTLIIKCIVRIFFFPSITYNSVDITFLFREKPLLLLLLFILGAPTEIL